MVVNVIYALVLAFILGISSAPVFASDALSSLDTAEDTAQYAGADMDHDEDDEEGDTDGLFPAHNPLALSDDADDGDDLTI
jgi:hypothetical protein